MRAEPSVLVGWRFPRRSTCDANVTSASSRSSSRTSAHVSPHSSETRAPVSAATMNSVRYGSLDAASVCSICYGVKIGRRFARATFGRSDDNIKVVGLVPVKPNRRAANL